MEDDCGVPENQFPWVGKCCSKSSSESVNLYKKACINCKVWSSLPYGTSLVITHIFGCTLHGYDQRVTE